MRGDNPVRRSLTIEQHENGELRVEVHCDAARWVFGVERSGKGRGRQARAWAYMNADGSPYNPNFAGVTDEAWPVAQRLLAVLDEIEAAAQRRRGEVEVSPVARLVALEAQVAALREALTSTNTAPARGED